MEENKSYAKYYSNFAGVSSSFFDFEIMFGRTSILDKENIQQQEQVEVVVSMSPQHAKSFALTLLENLSKYEDQFGEIVLPKSEEE